MKSEPVSTSPRERYLFLGSGLVLAVALVVGMAREQQWGTRWLPLHLISTNATGLRPGQEVRISGIPVGTVQTLELQANGQVKVRLRVQDRHALGRGLVEQLADAVLQQCDLDHVVALAQTDAAHEVPDRGRRHAAPAQARQGRHARIAPPLDVAVADHLRQAPFG